MDYTRLRAAALRDGEDEEAVTVDTRALIDKVLARYSGEWTTLRELIQNAADAQATTVKIKWETFPSTSVPVPASSTRSELLKHTIAHHTLRRLLVQNDGQPFTKTDWARLKRIAEGNPDETKIGAFGVGFYSVFADCEEPLVSSGSEAMAFYWKGNALFTRKMQLPEAQRSLDTAFVLDYRNATTPVPSLLSVSQFLATSLTFVALQAIEFWIDDWKVLSLQKKSSPSLDIAIPRDLETETKEGYMRVSRVERTSTQIDASFMSAVGWKHQPAASASRSTDAYGFASEYPSLRSFFNKLTAPPGPAQSRGKSSREEWASQEALVEDVTVISKSTIFLRVTSATITTTSKVSSTFATELERATKKPPPKTTKLAVLTSSYDETKASESTSSTGPAKKADIFASVLPTKKPGGRIFIGFPTMQTTGAGMHLSAPSLIPTVEREAIDLNARWVRTWNIEMLRAAGIMTRLAYVNEMADLSAKVKRSVEGNSKGITPADAAKFVPEARHTFQSFSFTDSTPSNQVGQIIEEAFWTSFKRPVIEVFSTKGVLPTSSVRAGSEELRKFVDGIPVVPEQLQDSGFVKKLHDFGLIGEITGEDVRSELETKALNKDQLIHFISWAAKKAASGELDTPSRAALLDVAVAELSDGGNQGQIIQLGQITNYLFANRIPSNLPIPPTTIPYSLTAACQTVELQALGWEPLEIVPWLRFLVDTAPSRSDGENITKSKDFAIKVLSAVSKSWDIQSQTSKNTIAAMLKGSTVMPTKFGMKKPTEAFFPTVKLFDDLPIIQGCTNLREKFLVTLGVRKTVDLDTIFARLLNPTSESLDSSQKKWSHMELIKYLASVKDDIPTEDLKKLRNSNLCPAEAGPKGMESTKPSSRPYKVSELFEPKDQLRALQLPILQWSGPPGSFRESSVEGKFLKNLGLRAYPSVPELVALMASPDETLRGKALAYFTANHQINGYSSFDIGSSSTAFIPIQGNDKTLVSPSGCFTNDKAAVLGYSILRVDLMQHAFKLGVKPNPPIGDCISKLVARPPKDGNQAAALFEYFATRLQELNLTHVQRLRSAPIVPVANKRTSTAEKSGSSKAIHYISPEACYVGTASSYAEIFDFVDFGPLANTFLIKCGSQIEPSKAEIARRACLEPARLLTIQKSHDRYLSLLKTLADDLPNLKKDKELLRLMRTSPWLLAQREIQSPSSRQRGEDLDDDDAPVKQSQLMVPSEIVINDDFISYRLFKDVLLTAPEDETIENFYLALGARRLHELVHEDVRIGPHSEKQDNAVKLRKHVLERSKLFLYEYSRDRREIIKHDTKWLEKNLTVEMVRSVALRRTLVGVGKSHTEKRSAASENGKNGWVLYVSAESRPDMYQVGQAVCQMILTRQSQQAYFFFEPFLKLDLIDLRARGYNVDRILRAKAAEARIAEDKRREALEAEQRQIRDREEEWARQAKNGTPAKPPKPNTPVMPGSFVNDSPEDPRAGGSGSQAGNKKGAAKNNGLFSNISRQFGFKRDGDSDDSDGDDGQQPKKRPGHGEKAPPNGKPTSSSTSQGKRPLKADDGRVTSPAVVQQNLLNAVKSTRAHDSETLFSPPHASEVKEQATYCDSTSEKNIVFAAEAANDMRVFVSRTMSQPAQDFLSANIGNINTFAAMLVDVGDVYGVRARSLHMFYDEAGGTIAFNSNGSVFFNLRFFIQLHVPRMDAATGARYGEAKAEAAVWWWVVLAHELAHNLVSTHNSEHSYYTESFIQEYFAKMMVKVSEWRSEGASGRPPATAAAAAASVAAPAASDPRSSLLSQAPPPPPYSTRPAAAAPSQHGSIMDDWMNYDFS